MGVAHVLNPVVCIQSDAFVSDVTNYGEKTPSKPYKHFYFYSNVECKKFLKNLK